MEKKKHIVFVINYFYPDLASTGQLMTDLCLELQNDYNISVIAAQPGYAGEVSNGKKIFEKSRLENINVISIKLPKVNKISKFSRIKYILTYFILANIALLKIRKVDIIYTISQPPVLGGLIGTIGKLFKKCKHVYNVQDFNPEQAAAVAYTKNSLLFYIAFLIDRLNCRFADHIVIVGHDMEDTLKRRLKESVDVKYSVINNWTNESEIVPLEREHSEIRNFLEENNVQDKFIIMYSGNMGLYYDLENLVKVAGGLKDNKDIVLLFIGEGAVKAKMQNFVNLENLKNVVFLPYQPKDYLKYSLNSADIHLVVNQKGIKGVSVPSKIYGVMAAGKPVLGVLEQGSEVQRLIERSNCGIVVEPQDYKGILKAINDFYNMSQINRQEMGMNGRGYLESHLKKETSIYKYNLIFKDI